MVTLDYRELSADGQGLEQLVRELALAQGFDVRWSGRGADAGRDLLILEPGEPAMGRKVRRWLVAAKDFSKAHGGAGRSVGLQDLGSNGGLVDTLSQHKADALLLACSTQPSANLVTRLEALEADRRVAIHIWDEVTLTRMLTTPRGWAVAQRFMPVSAGASGWTVFPTTEPNMSVGITRGMYMHLEERDRSTLGIQLKRIDARLDRMQNLKMQPTHELRPRHLMHDSRNDYIQFHYDLLWESHAPSGALVENIRQRLGNADSTYSDGVFDGVTIAAQAVDRKAAEYDPDHYRYYGPGSDRGYSAVPFHDTTL